jgi:hypothetical protein
MKPLRQAIDNYIALRRSLGFKLCGMADDLRKFVSFMEQKAAPYVTKQRNWLWSGRYSPLIINLASGRNDSVLSAYSLAIGTLQIRAPRFPP